MDGLEDFNETVSNFTQKFVLMIVPKVLHQLRKSVQLHSFDDGSIQRPIIDIFVPFYKLYAASQYINIDRWICDFFGDPLAEGIDDIIISNKIL